MTTLSLNQFSFVTEAALLCFQDDEILEPEVDAADEGMLQDELLMECEEMGIPVRGFCSDDEELTPEEAAAELKSDLARERGYWVAAAEYAEQQFMRQLMKEFLRDIAVQADGAPEEQDECLPSKVGLRAQVHRQPKSARKIRTRELPPAMSSWKKNKSIQCQFQRHL